MTPKSQTNSSDSKHRDNTFLDSDRDFQNTLNRHSIFKAAFQNNSSFREWNPERIAEFELDTKVPFRSQNPVSVDLWEEGAFLQLVKCIRYCHQNWYSRFLVVGIHTYLLESEKLRWTKRRHSKPNRDQYQHRCDRYHRHTDDSLRFSLYNTTCHVKPFNMTWTTVK